MKYLDQCIKIATVVSADLKITRSHDDSLYLLLMEYCSVKDSTLSNVLQSFCGRGPTIEAAAMCMIDQLAGKLLVYDPPSDKGTRKEIIVVSTQ